MQVLKDELRKKETALAEVVFRQLEGEALSAHEVKPGMLVFLKQLHQQAQVLEKPNENKQVLVQAGVMRVLVNLQDLTKVKEELVEQKGKTTVLVKLFRRKRKRLKMKYI